MKTLFKRNSKSCLALLVFVGCNIAALNFSLAHAAEVGSVKYARGAVTLQNSDGTDARLVGAKEKFKAGDVIKTGPKSFAIITLADDTRMTLRPKTTFAVESMNAKKTEQASAIVRLFRGGMRAITGFISKYNKKGYKVKTPLATIGIRGTEFDARLCEDDCARENKNIEDKHNADVNEAVARAVFVRGTLKVTSFAGRLRTVKAGDALFEGDTLVTGRTGYAILVFRDKSRVSLQANTEFRIDELNFDDEAVAAAQAASQAGSQTKAPEKSAVTAAETEAEKVTAAKVKTTETRPSALFSLLRGGLRTVTGLIGKLTPDSYRMRTRVATIGIRGTGYDALCTGACAGGETSGGSEDTLSTYVWLGKITVGGVELDTNQAAFLDGKTGKVIILPIVPDYFKNNPVPKPNLYKVTDENKLFTKLTGQKIDKGLFVSVTEGEVSVTSGKSGKFVLVQKGEAGFAGVDGKKVGNVPPPAFQQYDPVPKPDDSTPESIVIGDAVLGGGNKALICEIK